MIAMVMQKHSKSIDNEPIFTIPAISGRLAHINLHAENEGNLPCGF